MIRFPLPFKIILNKHIYLSQFSVVPPYVCDYYTKYKMTVNNEVT